MSRIYVYGPDRISQTPGTQAPWNEIARYNRRRRFKRTCQHVICNYGLRAVTGVAVLIHVLS